MAPARAMQTCRELALRSTSNGPRTASSATVAPARHSTRHGPAFLTHFFARCLCYHSSISNSLEDRCLGTCRRGRAGRQGKCHMSCGHQWRNRLLDQPLTPFCIGTPSPAIGLYYFFREVSVCFWTPGASAFFNGINAGFWHQNRRERRPQSVNASGVRFCSFTSREKY